MLIVEVGLECVEYDLRVRGNVIGNWVADGGEVRLVPCFRLEANCNFTVGMVWGGGLEGVFLFVKGVHELAVGFTDYESDCSMAEGGDVF